MTIEFITKDSKSFSLKASVVFPCIKSHFKRVANRIFTDFVIQGAGEITLEKKDNEILIKCFGESKSLKIKSRQIDALIIKDELEAEFND